MPRWNLLGLLIALLAPSLATAASPRPPGPAHVALQEPEQAAGTDAGRGAAEAASAQTLSGDAQKALEHLRAVLTDEGREHARELLEGIVRGLAEPEPGEEAARVAFLLELDRTAEQIGSLREQLVLRSSILELRARLLPPEHPDLLLVKQALAGTRYRLGDLRGAQELQEAVLAARTRLLPPDHPDLLRAKMNLALTRRRLGDLRGAYEILEAVHEVRTRILPPEHPDLLRSKENLALTRKDLGDLQGARDLLEFVHEARTRLLPTDHPDLLRAKQNLALTSKALGDLQGALALEEVVHEARVRLLPHDHPDLLAAKHNLAVTRKELGDLGGAHEIEEVVLQARMRLLPPDHPSLLGAKQSLAMTRKALGDLAGALELAEAVHEARTRILPPEHPDLLAAKHNLAATRHALGDLDGARELFEAVHEARARLLPPDHPHLLGAKHNLALTRRDLGDFAGARELFEAVLEAQTRLLPPEHPDLLNAKQSLAVTRRDLGEFEGALDLGEAVHEARARLLPPEHPDLLDAKQNLALTRKGLGDFAGARELVSSLLAGQRLRAASLRAQAARPAREGARAELRRLWMALYSSVASDTEPRLEPELFATLESLRLASVASAEAAHATAADPALAEEARRIAALRARLHDHVAGFPGGADAVEDWHRTLVALAEERDRAEGGLRRKLAEAGVFDGEADAVAVAARLGQDEAAASCLRYPRRFDKDPASGETPPRVDSLLAFVVRPSGEVTRVELGAAAEIEKLVEDWRRSLGKPIERGVALGGDEPTSETQLGRVLRARVLDPLLAAAGEGVGTLHVVLDDVLFLVPLDALPLDGEERVGNRYRIHVEPTLARLLREERPMATGGTLVALGGVDFDAEVDVESIAQEDGGGEQRAQGEVSVEEAGTERSATLNATTWLVAATPPLERSSRPEAFGPLRQTRYEVEDAGAQYEEAFGREPVLLGRGAATKSALFAAAPKARFLHVATHGWFASESFRSQLDSLGESSGRDAFARAEQTLAGFAPETLCGLALAGANRGKDALGRVPGILTAEELSSLDLRGCELAVLSACETNVGIRRAGQGIQSLQTALHAAGARTAITSLWKVDDAATRRLFELFYTKLWQERLGKADALWQAKMALRAEGYPTRDWAGWVLSGDPR